MGKFPRRMMTGLLAVAAAIGLGTQAQAQVATTSITGGTATDSIPAGTSGNSVLGTAGIGFAGGQIIVDGTLNVVSGGAQSPTVTLTLYDVGSESHWVNQIRLGNTTGAVLTDNDNYQRESSGGYTGPFTNAPFTRIGTVTQAAGVADLEFQGDNPDDPAPATLIVENGASPNQSFGTQPTSIALAYLNDSYQIVTGPTERVLVMLEDGGADRDYDDYVGILEVAAGSSATWGTVGLRVEGRPVSDPVQAFVSVTDVNGQPISGLTTTEITLLADGGAVSSPTLVLPPAQSSTEHLSVVFAMDYSGSVAPATRQAMEDAVIDFIASMEVGDYAAIVKSNVTNGDTVVQPFTAIAADNQVLINAVEANYPGVGTNLYDAVILAVQQFSVSGGSLPSGPKAVIVLSDGLDNSSTVDVNAALEAANAASIPIFTVGVGETGNTNEPILTLLATEAGGDYFPAPTNADIAGAAEDIFQRLNNEYLLTFASFQDCNPHLLSAQVTISGQTASAIQEFVRCTPLVVPDLQNQTLAAATTLLGNVGLALGSQTQETSATVPAGSVIRHSPVAGTEVAPGSSVNLVLSSGPPPGTVPNVVGLTQAAATTAITNASLALGAVTQQSSSSVAAGNVISQSVAPGQVLAAGSTVDLVVSSGPPTVAVPTATGLTQAAATTAITGASLVVGTVTQEASTTVASGSVISQTPSAGTQVAVGSAVNLVVSSGPPAAPPTPPPASGGSGGGGGAIDYAVVLMLLLLAGVSRRRRAVR